METKILMLAFLFGSNIMSLIVCLEMMLNCIICLQANITSALWNFYYKILIIAVFTFYLIIRIPFEIEETISNAELTKSIVV